MLNSVGIKIALGSFVIGISILLLFLITKNEAFAFVGYFYLIIAVILNLITLLYLIYNTIMYNENMLSNIYTGLIILLNIPIAYVCALVGLSYMF